MKVVSSWIKERLGRTMLTDQQVVEALDRAGIEIEQIISSKEIDKRVVAVLVKKVVQHPGADRLRLVEVTNGEVDFRIVCGAPNVHKGMVTALAQIGTVLPSGERIEKAKLRGEVSEGMLCSELELGLGNDHNGIIELSSNVAVGTPLCDIYPVDTVIDIKTPANRFDVQSVTGLAREVAAMTTAEFSPLVSPPLVGVSNDTVITQESQSQRYSLTRLQVNNTTPSSPEMIARLRMAGMRPISRVVDVTNYVMLETGQPLHAFDAGKVKLPVSVRYAETGETLLTLDGVKRVLTVDDLVIADGRGPIALAGVMGGKATEVDLDSTEILLEAAVFDGPTVRKMAKRHGLRTEASARLERGLPFELPPLGLSRAIELLGGKPEVYEQINIRPGQRSIVLPLPKLIKLLGFVISSKDAVGYLDKLGIKAQVKLVKNSKTVQSHETIEVAEVPWWRPDLRLPEDLIEEIVRVLGYDNVPATLPRWQPRIVQFDRVRAKRRQVRDLLYAAGLFEVMTYSFVSADQLLDYGYNLAEHLKLKNPLSTEQGYLRSSLLASHLNVLAKNRSYSPELGFYEVSKVFVKQSQGQQPQEPLRLGITVYRPEASYGVAKGILDALMHDLNIESTVQSAADDRFVPGRFGVVALCNDVIGHVGQIHPVRLRNLKLDGEAAYIELDLTELLARSGVRQFAGEQRFPTIARDITVLVPLEVTWQQVADTLTPLTRPDYVDEFYGADLPAGRRSLTLRLTVAHPDRTPTEAEATELELKARKILERKLRAQSRG